MIKLQLKVDPLPIVEPLVVRLLTKPLIDQTNRNNSDAMLVERGQSTADFDIGGFSLRVHTDDPDSLNGDVVLVVPGRGTLHRLIRSSSKHNTLLVTEQCDQKCIMCSQPPKPYHTDMFDSFLQAVKLAPKNATIGVSGGEPLLHKERLFGFLKNAQSARPDIHFHVLTNGQHLCPLDESILRALDLTRIVWGVPIYSANREIHDTIVAKSGAFDALETNLALLGRVGAVIELRTVVLKSNLDQLEDLANHISRHQSYAHVWAIMQLENIGYARMNWDKEFCDTSVDFDGVARAIDIATGRGLGTLLYNFPLCTVPNSYRRYCVASISDWKQKFLAPCTDCSLRSECTGFFEWYPDARGFEGIKMQ
jgi:His-Xaa-Ser system radical SAM maturase HxsC